MSKSQYLYNKRDYIIISKPEGGSGVSSHGQIRMCAFTESSINDETKFISVSLEGSCLKQTRIRSSKKETRSPLWFTKNPQKTASRASNSISNSGTYIYRPEKWLNGKQNSLSKKSLVLAVLLCCCCCFFACVWYLLLLPYHPHYVTVVYVG